jgi:hypothetical protein
MTKEQANSDSDHLMVDENDSSEEPPPVLKSWKNVYLLVLGNLLFWVALFTLFTWMFK